MTIEQRVATMVSVSLAKCLSLLLAAALVVGVWPMPIEQRVAKLERQNRWMKRMGPRGRLDRRRPMSG